MTHVLFVDDVFLFRKGSIKEANILKEFIYLYGLETRMEIRIHKYLSPLIERQVRDITYKLPF